MFCLKHSLTEPNIRAKFEGNRCFELYHFLLGFLIDTLFISHANNVALFISAGEFVESFCSYNDIYAQ